MFLSLLDPDPDASVRGMDPNQAPDPELDLNPDPDPLFKCMDPRIPITHRAI
jgi:hypothetical protein